MNTLLTVDMITRETARVLVNNLAFAKGCNREYDDQFAKDGAKIGYTCNVRMPDRAVVHKGQALVLDNAQESKVPVALDTQAHTDFQFSASDLLLSIDDFSKRFIQPRAAALATTIDVDGLALYKDVFNYVGAPGTVPTALLTYLTAGVRLDEQACPQDMLRSMVVTSWMQANIVDQLKGLFHAGPELAEQYRKGRMGRAAGFEWDMDQNCPTHTTGALGGAPQINAANQSGASIITDTWTSAAATRLLKGDVVQFAGCYAVNPQSRVSTGTLANWVVTADTASDGSGNMTIPISPSMVVSGPFQNCSGSPADNALVTAYGHASTYTSKVSPVGLAYHRDAFTLAMADLPLPKGVDMAGRVQSKELGVSFTLVRQFDISTYNYPCRVDGLYGWKTLRAEMACRVQA